ncbi:hypothetical protein T440DRAFT_464794 [Plenodomus tracheiphilus IPT5]|uniref:Uncharacterized protein n=1 Tax=Plenodomus tracheiphilus IPT5 TaxID=1408161 RepID=A0A6A7BJM4_9PLEO|nr:hypothetical protein T440DRAFT_464794 [Plenodomus tracheiphilus IPT5]
MAPAASHDSMARQQLPLSPPPSPQSPRRRHKKKKADAFEELALTPVPSRPSSPENPPGEEEESIITKIILTPILFISFIISLFLVNHRNRARRSKAHTTYSSILSYLAPSSWLDPEPYQDPTDSTWGRQGAPGHVEPHDALGPSKDASTEDQPSPTKKKKKTAWHLNNKIRKVAKLEISDAFEMRGRVIAMMLFMIVLGSVAMWMSTRWLVVSLSKMRTPLKS